MKLLRFFSKEAPLLWTLLLTVIFFIFCFRYEIKLSLIDLAIAFILAYGFWSLFLTLSKTLFKFSKISLLLSFPIFIFFLTLWLGQFIHHFLFGKFITMAQFDMIRLNWPIIAGQFEKIFQGTYFWRALGSVLVFLLTFIILLNYSPEFFKRPLRASHGIRYLAGVLWVVWLILGWGNSLGPWGSNPTLAGIRLTQEIFVSVKQAPQGIFGYGENYQAPPWLVKRQQIEFSQPISQTNISERPNILLVLLESIRADHLSSYGYQRETSPFLSSLIQNENVYQFDHALSNASGSYFSLTSLTSGLDFREKIEDFAKAPLIWDYLKLSGYHSFMITQSVGYPRYQLDQYFQTPGLDFYLDVGQIKLKEFYQGRSQSKNSFSKRLLKQFYEETGVQRDDQYTFEILKQKLGQSNGPSPFFGIWELECTHIPYCYPPAHALFHPAKNYFLGDTDLTSLINDYDNALAYTDHMLKKLFDLMHELNLFNNTVVIITADHGEAFRDHGQLFHGGTLYLEELRVPLIIYIPKSIEQKLGKNSKANLRANTHVPAQLIDILPTILDLSNLGKGAKEIFVGHSLLEPIPPDRKIYSANGTLFPGREHELPKHSWIDREGLQEIYYHNSKKTESFHLPIQ